MTRTLSIRFGRSDEEDQIGRLLLEQERERAKESQMSKPIDIEVLRDELLLVCVEVSLETIQGWTEIQRGLAERWALKTYLKANDNNVRVPPKPSFLEETNG